VNAYFGVYGISYRVRQGSEQRSILEEISFEMEQGEILALLGPNGAGKSTLLKILSGILRPVTGSQVKLRGEELTQMTPQARARMITYVGVELRAEFPLTAIEAVMMGRFCHHPMLSHRLSKEDLEEIRNAMEECRCWSFKDQELQTLSGGEKQLVALARALAQQSKIIILDEALSKMDLHHQSTVGKLLKKIAKKGRSFILVSHDVNLAAEWSDTALLLVKGAKKAHGKMGDVLTDRHFQSAYPDAEIAVGKNPFTGAPQLFFNTDRSGL
jgi:iron complex transport system ATP-binding protein